MENGVSSENGKPYYVLKIFIDTTICNSNIIKKYKTKVDEMQASIERYGSCDSSSLNNYVDAGFDLFTPHGVNINSRSYSNCINLGIKCAMTFNGVFTAFYLYPRSSTGAKTPLRLSNSVGIIDSGYRGHIMALFDNFSESNYNVTSNDRLTQICGPNIMYPICPVLVESVEELGITARGSGGLGSTGK
jgi:dUTP pyrophosphatase